MSSPYEHQRSSRTARPVPVPGGRGRRPRTPADLVGADLVHQVLDRARARRARQVLLTLDPSDPSASAVLEALQGAVGTALVSLSTRAAGSSVLVDADLTAPEPAGPPGQECQECQEEHEEHEEDSALEGLGTELLVLLR